MDIHYSPHVKLLNAYEAQLAREAHMDEAIRLFAVEIRGNTNSIISALSQGEVFDLSDGGINITAFEAIDELARLGALAAFTGADVQIEVFALIEAASIALATHRLNQ